MQCVCLSLMWWFCIVNSYKGFLYLISHFTDSVSSFVMACTCELLKSILWYMPSSLFLCCFQFCIKYKKKITCMGYHFTVYSNHFGVVHISGERESEYNWELDVFLYFQSITAFNYLTVSDATQQCLWHEWCWVFVYAQNGVTISETNLHIRALGLNDLGK